MLLKPDSGGRCGGCVCGGVTGGDATFAEMRLTIDPRSRRTNGGLTQRRRPRLPHQQPDVNYDTNSQEGRTR